MSSLPTSSRSLGSGRAALWLGVATLVLLFGGLGAWSLRAEIAGAVIAPGQLAVETKRHAVQSAEDGEVAALLVREGQRVAAGQALLRLNDAALAQDFELLELQLVETGLRLARLEAESENARRLRLTDALSQLVERHPRAAALLKGQRVLLAAHYETQARERAQLSSRRAQYEAEAQGLAEQASSLEERLALLAPDIAALRSLVAKKVSPAIRLRELERRRAELQGRAAELLAAQARSQAALDELALSDARRRQQAREEALAEMRDLAAREIELTAKRAALSLRRDRLELRAPVAGRVLGLDSAARRAVVTAGETIMEIVPEDLPLMVEAEVAPGDVDRLTPGQMARLRFPALGNRAETLEVAARLETLSADVFEAERGGDYYRATLSLPAEKLASLTEVALLPGMPVEAYIVTDLRSPLSYLTKPITDHFARALRD